VKACHIYINEPDHDFDRALAAEAERVAEESTKQGFPFAIRMRYARGNERTQWQQIQDDRKVDPHPDLVIVIPVNHEAVYDILYETVNTRPGVTCVFLHQTRTKMHHSERAEYKTRLFSVGADQVEIGRLQARQFASILPDRRGDVIYIQGRENSFGTKGRMKGLLEELPKTPDIKLNGFRVFGDWTGPSVRPAIDSWTQLGGKLAWIKAAGAQNDAMALALVDLLREQGLALPVIGVDGVEAGRQGVDRGALTATVIQPLGVGHAMRVYRDLLGGTLQPDAIPDSGNIVLPPESYPPLATLEKRVRPGAS